MATEGGNPLRRRRSVGLHPRGRSVTAQNGFNRPYRNASLSVPHVSHHLRQRPQHFAQEQPPGGQHQAAPLSSLPKTLSRSCPKIAAGNNLTFEFIILYCMIPILSTPHCLCNEEYNSTLLNAPFTLDNVYQIRSKLSSIYTKIVLSLARKIRTLPPYTFLYPLCCHKHVYHLFFNSLSLKHLELQTLSLVYFIVYVLVQV